MGKTREDKDKDALKLEFYSEYDQNGGDATAAAVKLGINDRTGRRWAVKRLVQQEIADSKNPHKILDQLRTGRIRNSSSSKKPIKILCLPDIQAKPGQCFNFLFAIGRYIVDKLPDIIVCIGDFADMPSLSSYDKGKKSFEGRRYKNDIKAVHTAMETLLAPLKTYNDARRLAGLEEYKPRMIMTLGNHENRINRAVEDNPELDGILSVDDLNYKGYGWEVYGFLEVVTINGVAFSHYFTSGVMGRPVSSTNALISKKHMSCVQGHIQYDSISTQYSADGKRLTGVFLGCCYEHDEDYLGPQGNNYWRGVWMLHEVLNGEFDPMQVSLKYLKNRY